MAESEVKSAALWIGKLVAAEIKQLAGVRNEVEILSMKLSRLAGFLMDASKNRHESYLVKATLPDCRDVAYDCEDIIESYILRVARHGYEQYEGFHLKTALRYACLVPRAISLYQIHSKLGRVTKRLTALLEDISAFAVSAQINNSNNQQPDPNLRRVYSHRREPIVVGLDNHLEELVDRLMDPNDKTVITICGMGGVGKSTLALELYHHQKLRGRSDFKAFGWATASRLFQPDEVLQNTLYSLVSESDIETRRNIDEGIKGNRAAATLFRMLEDLKCLVVIDDIWTPERWDQLRAAFPDKGSRGKGSRLVLTTRNQDLLSRDGDRLVHLLPLKCLDDKFSWELFEKTTFDDTTCPDSKKELGQQMLQHCKGVPMAIVVLAKLLKEKDTVEQWQQISADIQRGGVAKDDKDVYKILKISYDELAFHLKHCFLHLANFPEDYHIFAGKLYKLWTGEGIISKENTTNEWEEDIAERYLKELVNRNMVQVVEYWDNDSTKINACQIHDLMRDVCIDIARKENFLQQVNCDHVSMLDCKNANHLLMTSLPERDKRLRRLTVHVSQHHEAQSSTLHTTAATTSTSADVSRAPNLRTLLIFPKDVKDCDKEDCKRLIETICKDCPLLRVFDCKDLPIKGKLPKEVGDLIHLRYLGLRDTSITEVPSSIVKLQWLQTLNLLTRVGVVLTLPNILWKLKQLRHLYLPYFNYFVKTRGDDRGYLIKGGGDLLLDGLCNLRTLMNIDLDRVSLEGLFKLDRLEILSATCDIKKEVLSHFKERTSLKRVTLMLNCRIIDDDPMVVSGWESLHLLMLYGKDGSSYKLQKSLCFEMLPKSLVSLGFLNFQLDADPLPVVEKLPNLYSLSLYGCYDGSEMACTADGFPKLAELVIEGLSNLSSWEVAQGALPKLKKLQIMQCPLMTKAPDTISSSVTVIIK